jgi:hypothetical protein
MRASLHFKYPETSRASKARWSAQNRDRINARRRERRLKMRAVKLARKQCKNCTVLLVERLNWSPGRSYVYCRKCLTEHREEIRRHRWRRYYYRKNGIEPPKPKTEPISTRSFIETLKDAVIEEPMTVIPPDPFKAFNHKQIRVAEKTRTPISICACGSKYLKTRRGQQTCLPCIAYGDNSASRSRAMV